MSSSRHSEETFSAMKIQDYKHFLRLHLARDGSLTIYPIRVERVPRHWRDRLARDPGSSRLQPEQPLIAELIEPAIIVPGENAPASPARPV
jgi:hypothetical protein